MIILTNSRMYDRPSLFSSWSEQTDIQCKYNKSLHGATVLSAISKVHVKYLN